MSTLKKKERKKKKKGTLSDWQAFGLNSSNHAREPAAEAIWKKDLNVFLGNPPPPQSIHVIGTRQTTGAGCALPTGAACDQQSRLGSRSGPAFR